MTDEIDPIVQEQRALERDLETRRRLQEIGRELIEAARYQGPSFEERIAALDVRVAALESKGITPAAAPPDETESPDPS